MYKTEDRSVYVTTPSSVTEQNNQTQDFPMVIVRQMDRRLRDCGLGSASNQAAVTLLGCLTANPRAAQRVHMSLLDYGKRGYPIFEHCRAAQIGKLALMDLAPGGQVELSAAVSWLDEHKKDFTATGFPAMVVVIGEALFAKRELTAAEKKAAERLRRLREEHYIYLAYLCLIPQSAAVRGRDELARQGGSLFYAQTKEEMHDAAEQILREYLQELKSTPMAGAQDDELG